MRTLIVLSVGTLLLGAWNLAAEKKLKMESLPPAVQQTVKAETREATVVGLAKEKENGKIVYELETKKANGQTRDLTIDGAGGILSVEEQIELDAVPAPARAAIEKLAAGGKIIRVESLTERTILTAYEAEIERKGKNSTVSVKPDGSPAK